MRILIVSMFAALGLMAVTSLQPVHAAVAVGSEASALRTHDLDLAPANSLATSMLAADGQQLVQPVDYYWHHRRWPYRWNGGYYRYRWGGGYYRYRRWRGGRWFYY